MIEGGKFISARHIFFADMLYNEHGYPFMINEKGLPISRYYTYEFCGTANVNGKPFNFPLRLTGMGDPYLPHDFIVLEAVNLKPALKPLEFEEGAELGNLVYSSGRLPYHNRSPADMNSTKKRILLDFINYTFTGTISAILTDMQYNKDSKLQKIYRIGRSINSIEPGYSGGPVFDKNGKVIGMSVFLSSGHNFSHAISAKDLKIFIQNLNKKKP